MDNEKNSYLGILKNASFLKLWIGQMISYIGDRIAQMAFLAWMITSYHKSAAEMAQITFFSMLPLFLFSGLAGAVADRLSRKWVMVISNVIRGLLVFIIASLASGGHLPFLFIYVFVFVIGTFSAFFVPARLAIIPNIVAAEELQAANALSAGAGMIATLIGTYFAGILIEKSGFFMGFAVNGAFYVVAGLILAWIYVKQHQVESTHSIENKSSDTNNFKEVMNYLRTHKRAWEVVLLSVALSFVSSFFYIGLTVLAIDYLHLGTAGLGKLLSMLGIGMIAGSVIVMMFGKHVKPSYQLILSFAIIFLTTITAKCVNSFGMAWVWLILIGIANAILLIFTDTVLQKITPDRFRGKVFGFRAMVTNGVFLVSLLAVGQLLKVTSPFEVFSILSLTSFVILLIILFTQEQLGYRIFRAILRLFLKTFFAFEVEGTDYLRYKNMVILAGNHTGYLDSLVLMAAFNRRVLFMVNRKVFSWRFVGGLVKRAGVIPVDEGKGVRAIEMAVEELKRGRVVGIFPEGELSKDGKMGMFRKGVARLKTDSGAPIIPFVIHGGYEAWAWGKKWPRFRKIVLQFGQPILNTDKNENELVKDIRDRIEYMKEALERRDSFRNDPKAYQASVLDLMQLKSDVYGARTALQLKEKSGWKELSFIELSRRARDFSSYILENGFQKGEKIAILSESRPEWGIAFFASIHSGAVTVPLDIKLTQSEWTSILTDAKPRILCISGEFVEAARLLRSNVPSIQEVIVIEDGVQSEFSEFNKLKAKQVIPGVQRQSDETALIIYTSGTTGNPKGVMISFGNLIFQVQSFETIMNLTSNDLFLSILPLNHLLELTSGFMGVLHAGGKICYCKSLHPQEISKTMTEKKVTMMITVPLFLKVLKGSVDKQIRKQSAWKQRLFKIMFQIAKAAPLQPLKKVMFSQVHKQFGGRLRGFICGGAPLDVEVGSFFETIGIPVYQGYGLSETSPVITANTPEKNRMGSVGVPLKEVEVKITNDGKEGEEGEILTRGPHVMQGYYGREDLTKEVIDKDGWFHTGDLGKIDKDGFLFITGRIKNLIVLGGGKKIHPEEVETALSNTPLIKEICVLSKVQKDGLKEGTEEVCAVIVPSDDLKKKMNSQVTEIEKEIKKETDRLNENLAHYKRPSRIYIHLEDLPKTATRKIKRPLVNEWLKSQ